MGDSIRSLVGASTLARVGLLAVVLSALALSACSDDEPKPGDGAFGTRCDEDKDCESLICAGLEGETKLCTEACTDPLGDECEEGFRCRRPERKEALVCVCTDPRGCEREQPGTCSDFGSCDDDVACTIDSCDGDSCEHTVRPDLCAVGSRCDTNEGCVENEPCSTSADCGAHAGDCTQSWFCDPVSSRCQYEITDNDLDGVFPVECGGDDCDDFDGSIGGRDRFDSCDMRDNDCDGRFDEDAELTCGDGMCTLGDCACEASLRTDCSAFGGGCVDTSSDPFNCGGCGFVCEAGLACIGGACQDQDECSLGTMCPPHSTCTNIFAGVECQCDFGFEPNAASTECIDVNECDRGLHSCGGAECINLFGSFQCNCDPGFDDFGFGCTDVNECDDGFDCGHGACQNLIGGFECDCDAGYEPHPTKHFCELTNECQANMLPGFRWCAGACRDVLNDDDFCGSCSHACTGDTFCSNGVCDCDDSSLTYCNLSCVNTQSNVGHCGECNHACPDGAGCVNGDCFCPMGQTACGGTCTPLGTTQSCLSCDDVCPIGASCTGTGCKCPGSAPDICDGQCVNTDQSELYCGSCFRSCPEGATCNAGECDCPAEAPSFCEGFNTCNDFDTSEQACGSCDIACGVVCNDGACAEASSIALGGGMGCVLFSDGRVGCFGSNDSGRLGRSLSTSLTSVPIGLLALTGIEAIAARDAHACALQGDGDLYCWGENGAEQLGNGNTTDQPAPVLTRRGVAQVAVGLRHTCVVLSAAGKVECIGSDELGQRGDGAMSPAFGTWTAVTGLEHVDKLVSGQNHLCALIDGEVFCWGDNTSGQLGVGTSGAAAGLDAPTTKVTGLADVIDIAAGRSHTCALQGDGDLYCWGENGSSQSGSADTGDRLFASLVGLGSADVVEVAAGDAHTCVRISTGDAYCWGSGADRQNASTTTGSELHGVGGPWLALAAGSAHSCAIYVNGDFYCWGDGPSITNGTDTAGIVRIER